MRRLADALEANREALVQPLSVDTARTAVAAGEVASDVASTKRRSSALPH